jgi:uncharacterized membrane protein
MRNSMIKQSAKVNLQGKYGIAILALLIVFAVSYAVSTLSVGLAAIFVLPIYIGYAKFHIILADNSDPDVDVMFDGFRDSYFDHVLVMFLQKLFLFLWTLLLIVPGIVKMFSYALVPYILQDEDYDVLGTDAITLSREMMNGYKAKLFMLHLSFIGWYILTVLTLGLLSLYVQPYLKQCEAIFYQDVKLSYHKQTIKGE